MSRCAAVFALAILLGVSGAFGDEESARYFSERGDKALAEKDYEGAEKHYRKALTEQEDCLPALLGLAETARARKKTEDAVGYLEACLEKSSDRKLTEEEAGIRKRAEELLKKLDRARFEYRALVADYVGKLLKLARKHQDKDPELTRRCVERILRLEPQNPDALAIRQKVGGGAAPAAGKAPRKDETALYNGKDLKDWVGEGPQWEIKDGILIGNAGNKCCWLRNKEQFTGSYALEFEVRISKDTGRLPTLALRYAVRGAYHCHDLNLHDTGFELTVYDSGGNRSKITGVEYYVIPGGFDRNAWNTFRIEIEPNDVRIKLNGKKLFEHEGDGSDGCFDGFVGIMMQDCSIEVRRVALVK